jgi:hypothetical protein
MTTTRLYAYNTTLQPRGVRADAHRPSYQPRSWSPDGGRPSRPTPAAVVGRHRCGTPPRRFSSLQTWRRRLAAARRTGTWRHRAGQDSASKLSAEQPKRYKSANDVATERPCSAEAHKRCRRYAHIIVGCCACTMVRPEGRVHHSKQQRPPGRLAKQKTMMGTADAQPAHDSLVQRVVQLGDG